MFKNLLAIAVMSALSTTAMAHETGAKVFSNNARYKITGANLVTNGDFSDLQLGGWTATDASIDKLTTFTVSEGTGAKGANEIKVNAGQTGLTNGIYQVIDIDKGGTYIVSLKVKNTTGAGFTDFDLTGGNTNYINAYYNTDGTLAQKDGQNYTFGTDGVSGGYTFSYGTEGFTEVNFPVVAPAEGKIVIDLRGLAADLKICDVTCQYAEKIYNTRIPTKRIAYINSVLNSQDFSDRDSYQDVVDAIQEVQDLIDADAEDGFDSAMENLDLMWDAFVEETFENVLNTINTGAAGNASANWENWTGKYNKLNQDYKDSATSGWTWNTDRWCHKTASANSPMSLQWMRGASGNWDNIATNTTTLDKGIYYFGVQGAGGMMSLDKNRWARSLAKECAETELFFNGDTTAVFVLPTDDANASIDGNVIYKFEVAEDNTKLTFGIRCNIGQGLEETNGFDVNFRLPVLYKTKIVGQLTEAQKTYISNVGIQNDAFKSAIESAETLKASAEKPWGKDALQAEIDEAKKRYAKFSAISQDEMLEAMDNETYSYTATAGADYEEAKAAAEDPSTFTGKEYTYTTNAVANVVMNAGVRFINNYGVKNFNNLNAPLTEMPVAIEEAKATKENPLYADGNKTAYQTAIDAAQKAYDDIAAKTTDATREADVAALADAKTALAEATETFIKSAEKTPLATFDFEAGYEKVGSEDEGFTFVVKSVEGNMKMEFAEGQLSDKSNETYDYDNCFQIVKSKSPAVNDGNILLIGNSANLLDLGEVASPTEDDVLRVDMTMYNPVWGNSVGTPEVLFLDADKATIGGFRRGVWNAMDYNSFAMESGKFFETDKPTQLKDCFEIFGGSRVDYQFILDFKALTMQATVTQYTGGTEGCTQSAKNSGEVVAFPDATTLAKYISISGAAPKMASGRRSSVDDIKIYKYASKSPVTGIKDVQNSAIKAAQAVKKIVNGQLVIVKDGKTYTISGAQVK